MNQGRGIYTKQPHTLVDALTEKLHVRSDADLAAKLGVSGAVISRIRNEMRPPSASLILTIYDKTGWSIEHIRDLMKKQMLRESK